MSAKNMSNNTATVFDNANKFVLAFIENLDILDEQDVIKITNSWKKNTEKFNELFVSLIKKSATRAKKAKDAPKNAKSAYMFYCQEMRANVKEENPDLSAKEITIKLGEMWKEVKETDEVVKYIQMASSDEDRYKAEMENYVPAESNSESQTSDSETEPPKSSKVDAKKSKEPTKKTPGAATAKETTAKKETKKTVKKQSNEDIVRDIIENCDGESITMKLIKDELKKKGIELSKDELKAIISKINEDDDE